MEQNLTETFHRYRSSYCLSSLVVKHEARTITRAQTNTDTSRGVSSPTALFLRGEVDLEVVRIVVDVEEAAALVELTDTTGRNGKEDGINKKNLQPPHRKTFKLIPDAFDRHRGEVPLMDPFLQLKLDIRSLHT